jgi:hypothetical protein
MRCGPLKATQIVSHLTGASNQFPIFCSIQANRKVMTSWVYCSVAVLHRVLARTSLPKTAGEKALTISRYNDLPQTTKPLVNAFEEWITTEIMSWKAEDAIFFLQVGRVIISMFVRCLIWLLDEAEIGDFG